MKGAAVRAVVFFGVLYCAVGILFGLLAGRAASHQGLVAWRSAAWAVSAVAFAAPARRVLHYLIAGTLWGGLAYLLGYRAFGRPIWGGVLAGPFIGAIVGGLLQRPFERRSRLPRSLLALASLYLGATLFGLALAVTDWRALTAGTAHPLQAVGAEIVAVWWGITLTGFLLFLWPLAYGTHWLLEWYETR